MHVPDGFLDAPTDTDAGTNPPHLFLAPAERADIIVDFSGQSGRSFIMVNGQGAFAPFPSGDPPDPNTSGQIMEFRVNQTLQGTDTTFNPANPQIGGGAPRRSSTSSPPRPAGRPTGPAS